jgi:hypothetical protein
MWTSFLLHKLSSLAEACHCCIAFSRFTILRHLSMLIRANRLDRGRVWTKWCRHDVTWSRSPKDPQATLCVCGVFLLPIRGKKDQQPSGQHQTREWQASVPKAVSDWLIAQPPIPAVNFGVFLQPKAVIFSGWCHNVIVSVRFVKFITIQEK